jgi:hypothetical protein
MVIRWCSLTQNTEMNNDGNAMWKDELQWQFDVVVRRKIQGWTTMAMRCETMSCDVKRWAAMAIRHCSSTRNKGMNNDGGAMWNDELLCETMSCDGNSMLYFDAKYRDDQRWRCDVKRWAAMWNDELRWQFDVVVWRKIQGWTTMAMRCERMAMRCETMRCDGNSMF